MGGHMSHEASVARATKIIIILAIMTISEVLFALWGKGYLVEGFTMPGYIVAAVMIIMSLVKAYLIIYEFMHMKYEVPAMVKSVLLPMALLIWAIIAFFSEGAYWKDSRTKSKEVAKTKMQMQQGSLMYEQETKKI